MHKPSKSILLKCALLSLTLPANAMENNSNNHFQSVESKHSPQKVEPLMFKIDPKTGTVEDSKEGEGYIYKFQCATRDAHAKYGAQKHEAQKKLDEVEEKLKTMPEDSDASFVTAIHKTTLTHKVAKLEKKTSDILDNEIMLEKYLMEMYKSNCTSNYSNFAVPNYEFFLTRPFNTLEKLKEQDFKPAHWLSDKPHTPYYIVQSQVRYVSPSLYNKMENLCQSKELVKKLLTTQEEMFRKANIAYHVATNTENELNDEDSMVLKKIIEINEVSGKSPVKILREQMEGLIWKVERIYIPAIEQGYRFAKVVIAFEKEIRRYKDPSLKC